MHVSQEKGSWGETWGRWPSGISLPARCPRTCQEPPCPCWGQELHPWSLREEMLQEEVSVEKKNNNKQTKTGMFWGKTVTFWCLNE